jgi:hypothetical protein
MKRFTHRARLYGFRVYFNPITQECKGMTYLEDFILEIFIWLAIEIFNHEGFTFTEVEKL